MSNSVSTDFYGKEIKIAVEGVKNLNDAEVIFDTMASTIAVKATKKILDGLDEEASREELDDAKDLLKTMKDYMFKKKAVQIEQTQVHKHGQIDSGLASDFMNFLENKRKITAIDMEDAEIVSDERKEDSKTVLDSTESNTEVG